MWCDGTYDLNLKKQTSYICIYSAIIEGGKDYITAFNFVTGPLTTSCYWRICHLHLSRCLSSKPRGNCCLLTPRVCHTDGEKLDETVPNSLTVRIHLGFRWCVIWIQSGSDRLTRKKKFDPWNNTSPDIWHEIPQCLLKKGHEPWLSRMCPWRWSWMESYSESTTMMLPSSCNFQAELNNRPLARSQKSGLLGGAIEALPCVRVLLSGTPETLWKGDELVVQ